MGEAMVWLLVGIVVLDRRRFAPKRVDPTPGFWRCRPVVRVFAAVLQALPALTSGQLGSAFIDAAVGAVLWAPVWTVLIAPIDRPGRQKSTPLADLRKQGQSELEKMRAYQEQASQAKIDASDRRHRPAP
jgi:hypothetical protein